MAKKDQSDVAAAIETPVVPAPKNTVKITNRDNAPYDFTLITLGICKRLEPRGKPGDTIDIPAEWIKHKDFESAQKYLIVTE